MPDPAVTQQEPSVGFTPRDEGPSSPDGERYNSTPEEERCTTWELSATQHESSAGSAAKELGPLNSVPEDRHSSVPEAEKRSTQAPGPWAA